MGGSSGRGNSNINGLEQSDTWKDKGEGCGEGRSNEKTPIKGRWKVRKAEWFLPSGATTRGGRNLNGGVTERGVYPWIAEREGIC